MSQETKRIGDTAELVRFGEYLNHLHDADRTFEMPDSSRRMKPCSLNEVIDRFQTFFDGKAESFKVRITLPGGLTHTTTEFKRMAKI